MVREMFPEGCGRTCSPRSPRPGHRRAGRARPRGRAGPRSASGAWPSGRWRRSRWSPPRSRGACSARPIRARLTRRRCRSVALSLICASVLCIGSIANTRGVAVRALLLPSRSPPLLLALRLDRTARVRLLPTGMLSARPAARQGLLDDLPSWACRRHPAGSTSRSSCSCSTASRPRRPAISTRCSRSPGPQARSWVLGSRASARIEAIVLGPLLMASGFVGLFLTIGSGPVRSDRERPFCWLAAASACWTHIGAVILSSDRADEGTVTASMHPDDQLFAIALGSAVSGIIANQAGLAADASPATAARAGSLALRQLHGRAIDRGRHRLAASPGAAAASLTPRPRSAILWGQGD